MAVFGKGILTGQESVELDQQSSVGVLRLGSLAVARTDVMVVKIDTHGAELRRCMVVGIVVSSSRLSGKSVRRSENQQVRAEVQAH